jgi:hypothetical protein
MSPEQAAGMRADALTDVYAVGGLLYEMLTATPPCAGEDVLTVLNKKATEDPVPIGKLRPALPAEVQELVMRALSRRPKDRHASMSVLKDDVLRCVARIEGTPALAERRATSAEARTRRSTERTRTLRPRPWVLGAAAGGFVGLMALVSFVRRSSDAPPPEPAASAEPTAAPATAAATPPVIVPVEPLRGAPPPPAQEPVTLKRAARVVEPPPATAPAPSLAAPWPAPSPPVYPREPSSSSRHPVHANQAPTDPASVGSSAPEAPAPEPPPASPPPRPTPSPTAEDILARGQAAFDRGYYPEAIRRAKEAMAAGAAVPGHLLVADSFYHLQRYADALREYEAALALEPSNALARRGRELASHAAAAAP